MFESMAQVVELTLAGFDPATVPLTSAESTWLELDRAERLIAGAKVRLVGRVAEARGWERAGRRSAADHLAVLSGTTVGAAMGMLATSKRLADLPVVTEALADGRLSSTQVQSIAEAAAAAPHEQATLVEAAGRESVSELRERCGRVKATADKDPEATHERLHAARSLRHRKCSEGGAELTYRSTVNEVAEVLSVVRAFSDKFFKAAGKAGRQEPAEAHMADGLLAAVRQGGVLRRIADQPSGSVPPSRCVPPCENDLPSENDLRRETDRTGDEGRTEADRPTEGAVPAEAGRSGRVSSDPVDDPLADQGVLRPPPVEPGREESPLIGVIPKDVVIRIDWDAWVRGWPIGGEVCEIPGLGSVPVSLVKATVESGDAVLKAVVTRGVDVVKVVNLGRHPNAAQKTALAWLDLVCIEAGCGQRAYLEIDHTVPFTMNRVTALELLEPRCKHHHRLKTKQDLIDIAAHRRRDRISG
jgi:hypothetical protein